MTSFRRWLEAEEQPAPGQLPPDAQITRSQEDGWKITTPHGYIDYRHNPDEGTNEIWWVEAKKRGKGHGKKLVDLMQTAHPADTVGWGVTTPEGKDLRDSWHKKNPHVQMADGAFEGQYDPSGNNYGQDEDEDDFDDFEDEDEEEDADF